MVGRGPPCTAVSFTAGPMVRIHIPPAVSQAKPVPTALLTTDFGRRGFLRIVGTSALTRAGSSLHGHAVCASCAEPRAQGACSAPLDLGVTPTHRFAGHG